MEMLRGTLFMQIAVTNFYYRATANFMHNEITIWLLWGLVNCKPFHFHAKTNPSL